MKPQSEATALTPVGSRGTELDMAKAQDPPAGKRGEREEKLAAALRANLRRRKAEAAERAKLEGVLKEPEGS